MMVVTQKVRCATNQTQRLGYEVKHAGKILAGFSQTSLSRSCSKGENHGISEFQTGIGKNRTTRNQAPLSFLFGMTTLGCRPELRCTSSSPERESPLSRQENLSSKFALTSWRVGCSPFTPKPHDQKENLVRHRCSRVRGNTCGCTGGASLIGRNESGQATQRDFYPHR